QGYENIEENSVYLKFKIVKGNKKVQPGDYILSWTTTPWTLPGNVALAIGKDFDYVKIKKNNENLILAKDLLSAVIEGEYEIINEIKGSDLIGVAYEPLFSEALPTDVKNYQNAFKVYPADFVSVAEGTGVVHTAVMYGEDDYNLGEQVGLPKYHTVEEDGQFVASVKTWAGQFVKDKKVEQAIVADLKNRGLLYAEKPYRHDYPFCWRCDSPLLYYAKDSWFIKMSSLKNELVKNNQEINWVPDYIKEGRFGEWLAGIKDWAISRERYWGTPLPIWICEKCGAQKCIGSKKELGKELDDLHRPYIDEVEFACDCGGQMKRIKEVADCWFDSGAMPFAQWHYPFENKEKIDEGKQYPADYISEAIDQTRGWFYTLLAISTFLGKGASYKNVICLGHINDAEGQKMSKSKGNVVNPWDMINKYGSDAIRWYMYTMSQPGDYKNFDEKGIAETVKKIFLILWNVLSFYKMYTSGKAMAEAPKSDNLLDQWLLAKLNQLTKETTERLDKYDVTGSARGFNEFINDLSTWYLRRSRARFKGENDLDKQNAIHTLGFTLLAIAKLMAPYVPFISDKLYQELGGDPPAGGESVHLEDWPMAVKIDENVLGQMALVRQEAERGLSLRKAAGLKLRQPLASYASPAIKQIKPEFLAILREELNVKEVLAGEADKLDTALTEELKQEGLFRELVRQIN
ncbi:MAG: isoleucine--tRNA ligase, partial [bacterium]